MLLAGCGEPTESSSKSQSDIEDSTSSSSESSSSSSSYVDNYANKWNDADKALLTKYCGSVLPYPEGKMTGTITLTEATDSNGNQYLEITDQATSFTLKDYYDFLLGSGWNGIAPYDGDIIQTDTSGLTYVECTKNSADGKTGYDLIYYYVSESTNEDGESIPGHNIIKCYNDASSTAVSDTAWDDVQKETIKFVTTTTLPFIQLGKQHGVSATSDSSTLALIDLYTKNLCGEYASLLEKDGFKLDKINSKFTNMYCLDKTLDNGSTISATLYYLNGNNFYFRYKAKATSYSSWPTEISNEIAKKTGVTIPEFSIDEGKEYQAYVKNNTYHIEGKTSDFTVSYDYDDALAAIGLTQSSTTWKYSNWEETISILPNSTSDGFSIDVEVTEPTSSFSASWPTDAVSSAIKNLLKVNGVTLPALPDESIVNKDRKIKYEERGEEYKEARYEYYYNDIKDYPPLYDLGENASDEEIKAEALKRAEAEMGLYISISDIESAAWDGYTKALENAGFYVYYDEYENNVYEDRDGKIGVTLTSYSGVDDGVGVTTILIHKGSGETHTPELSFSEDEVECGIGETTELSLNKNMLPYAATFTSSDTTGKITVNEKGEVIVAADTPEGSEATITATITTPEGKTYTATCLVKAKKILSYTKASAIDAVGKLLEEKGIEAEITHSTDDDVNVKDYINATFEKSVGVDYIKSLVKESLIPEGFEINGDWMNADLIIGNSEISGYSLNYSFEDEKTCETIYFEFQIYESGDSLILRVLTY